ncbi:MAG TPA: choice-of-anchor Q domain-containing protein [Verrucomicrobiae bacterium]|nr:choice-of-anchor Q domain-containing protein [Verrucomicrobiae bacterium]
MHVRTLIAVAVLAVGVSRSYAATITVTSTNDSGPGSLRDALASAANGDTIDASGVSGTILLTNGGLLVTNSVNIVGPGYNTLTVIGRSDRGFRIGPSKTVGLSGLGISSAGHLAINGGGIYNDHATLILTNCSIGGIFTTSAGGAIFNDGSGGSATLRIAYCLINGSTASAGAAIYNDGTSGSATLEIVSSTVSRNSTIYIGSGGGVINDGTSGRAIVKVNNSTFYANAALGGVGGGILNEGSGGTAIVQIANCTFDDNEGQDGGAIYNSGSGGTATVEIDSTILVALAPGVNIFNDSGTVTSLGYNLSSDDGGGFLSATGDQIDTNSMLDLAGPQDNGGLTPTIALERGSPAIDAGNPNFTPPPYFDQRGPCFLRVVRGRIDIGAFEVQDTPVFTCPLDLVAVFQQLDDLNAAIQEFGLPRPVQNALVNKLKSLSRQCTGRHPATACGKIDALIHQAEHDLANGRLTESQAVTITTALIRVRGVLGC